uniref:Egg protein CP501 n=1 Tax=Schistosoma japonicum TaxID=6182 RepID=Q6PYU9_SCHJA|nr:egg protein CP501 [Schistosoma japonicum]
MRIINLVNISTVLLLINLLQTKSQANGEDTKNGIPDDPGLTKSTELKVEVQALLKDKETNMRVKWNENLLDDTKPEYHKLLGEACKLFLPFVKKIVLSSQNDGECKDVTFTKYVDSTKDGAVNVKLTITFKDSVAINQKPMDLKLKLENDFKIYSLNLRERQLSPHSLLKLKNT